MARRVFQSLWDRNLYVGGAMNMLDQPEFGIGTMRALLKTFEEKRQLIEPLTTRAQGSDGVQVVIGSEMPFQELHETSLVAASYRFRDPVLGVLGVVGPRRMPYAKIVPLVEYTARLVSRRLTGLGGVHPAADHDERSVAGPDDAAWGARERGTRRARRRRASRRSGRSGTSGRARRPRPRTAISARSPSSRTSAGGPAGSARTGVARLRSRCSGDPAGARQLRPGAGRAAAPGTDPASGPASS